MLLLFSYIIAEFVLLLTDGISLVIMNYFTTGTNCVIEKLMIFSRYGELLVTLEFQYQSC